MDRHDRNEWFFGKEGQALIGQQRTAVIGCGGLGEHVIPQLACLGVKEVIGLDDEDLEDTNRNRYILARHTDPAPGTHKVDIARRAVNEIDSGVLFTPVKASLRSAEAFDALSRSTVIFGCLDNDGSRLVLMEFALAHRIPYFDLATDIPVGNVLDFGGRISLVDHEPGCLVCAGLLDLTEARKDLESAKTRADADRIYGIEKRGLETSGPSVVSLNGVVASMAVTEFIMRVTGLRAPNRLLSYRGRTGVVTRGASSVSASDCYYCQRVKGAGASANIERYIV